jgi:hypothetical protein
MRIVALSDQHRCLPEIPPCDLLIVAGDVCPDLVEGHLAGDRPERQRAWFDAHARPWLSRAPATHRILTWGNHDFCGRACRFDSDAPGAASSTELQIVLDRGTRVPARGAADQSISIWATPWSHEFDILVSHQPPLGHGDASDDAATGEVVHLGSRELLDAIRRVKPSRVICAIFTAATAAPATPASPSPT